MRRQPQKTLQKGNIMFTYTYNTNIEMTRLQQNFVTEMTLINRGWSHESKTTDAITNGTNLANASA